MQVLAGWRSFWGWVLPMLKLWVCLYLILSVLRAAMLLKHWCAAMDGLIVLSVVRHRRKNACRCVRGLGGGKSLMVSMLGARLGIRRRRRLCAEKLGLVVEF